MVAPCGGLRPQDGRYWCSLVLDAKSKKDRLQIEDQLYIGAGCSSSLNSDRRAKINQLRSTSSSGTQTSSSGKSGKSESSGGSFNDAADRTPDGETSNEVGKPGSNTT
jgi:hypothetical protein